MQEAIEIEIEDEVEIIAAPWEFEARQEFHLHEVKVVEVLTERKILKVGGESKQLDTELPETMQDVYSSGEFEKI